MFYLSYLYLMEGSIFLIFFLEFIARLQGKTVKTKIFLLELLFIALIWGSPYLFHFHDKIEIVMNSNLSYRKITLFLRFMDGILIPATLFLRSSLRNTDTDTPDNLG